VSTPRTTGSARSAPRADQRLVQGAATRHRILARALVLAGSEGLEALTIGKLAEDLGMSKAGLFGHFGSKEDLQLAVVDEARRDFVASVGPALLEPEGLPRLLALCSAWLAWARASEGGCFFASAASEFDGRSGPVRDRVAQSVRDWLDGLTSAVDDARRLGHLEASIDPRQLAFELHSLELGGNACYQLFRDREDLARAERAIAARIEAARAPEKAGAPRRPK
jgi:AcrR family transcriptional regulator